MLFYDQVEARNEKKMLFIKGTEVIISTVKPQNVWKSSVFNI